MHIYTTLEYVAKYVRKRNSNQRHFQSDRLTFIEN